MRMPPETAFERREALVELYRETQVCRDCGLADTRSQVVFGSGNADADLMFVGEAPGAEEDRRGLPFVGRAGKLLDEMLDGIGLARSGDAFIANILKSRPPGNRDPLPEEIAACTPRLMRQIELIRPLLLCTLGNFATKFLTGDQQGITRVRGEVQRHRIAGLDIRVLPLFHPAAALRTPAAKDLLREDFAKIPAILTEARGEQS